jgi:V/A-type H+-transporting ATPase subunit K
MKCKKITNLSVVTLLIVAASFFIVSQLAIVDAGTPDQPALPAGDNPNDILPLAEEPDIDYSDANVTVEYITIEDDGMKKIGAGLAVGLAGLGAAIGMGQAGSAAIGAISEKPELFGKTIIFVVFIEAVAIYGLLISILIVFNI